jgi:hypothetical protein
MRTLKLFSSVSAVLLSCSSAVVVGGWQALCYQPTDALIVMRPVHGSNWQPILKSANDQLFDLKVEAGVVPAPVSKMSVS